MYIQRLLCLSPHIDVAQVSHRSLRPECCFVSPTLGQVCAVQKAVFSIFQTDILLKLSGYLS